ncbi:hypothetical protein N665_0613s0043 [Sinapis alba]|nr:hypothetical protein N665_0613s0043 [Sinapis alba]
MEDTKPGLRKPAFTKVDQLRPGTSGHNVTVKILSTKMCKNQQSTINMFKGSMRLAVDKWGRVEVTQPATFKVKEDTNMSLVEYELVNAVE